MCMYVVQQFSSNFGTFWIRVADSSKEKKIEEILLSISHCDVTVDKKEINLKLGL